MVIEKVKNILQKKWLQTALFVIGMIAAVYIIVYIDVVSRAREAYLEGEKYWSWHHDQQLKIKQLDEEYAHEKKLLERRLNPNIIAIILGKKKLSKEEYQQQIEALEFEHKRRLEESSIKYAYVWYQTVVELFTPPESKWVKLSRQKMPVAKEMWKQELRSKNIPFEDYMLE